MVIIFFVILIAHLLILRPTFHIGLSGDDYLAINDYLFALAQDPGAHLISWKFLLSPYGMADTIVGILYQSIGLKSVYFYLLSFVLRTLAVFSFYPLLNYFTKNKLAIFISMLFFALTTAGLETSNWAFNMASYISIFFLNLFITTYFKSKELTSTKFLFLSFLLFFLTIVTQPIRMTGLPIFLVLIEIFWLIFHHKFTDIRWSLFQLIGISLTFILILSIGNSIGNGHNLFERINSTWGNTLNGGTATPSKLISSGQYQIIINPIIQIGSVLLPDSMIPHALELVHPEYSDLNILKIWVVALLISWLLKKCVSKLDNKFLILTAFLTFIWIIAVKILLATLGLGSYQNVAGVHWSLIGGFTLIMLLEVIFYYRNEKAGIALFTSFSWLFCSFLLAWMRFPLTVQITTQRYLIVTAVAIAILFGTTVSLGETRKKQLILSSVICALILIQGIASFNYLMDLRYNRDTAIATKIHRSFPKISQLKTHNSPLVFYFEGSDYKILYQNILFGFPAFVAIEQHLKFDPTLVYTDNWLEIVSAYQNGQSIARFNNPVKPVPIENIYSYRINDQNELVDTTDQTRIKLKGL